MAKNLLCGLVLRKGWREIRANHRNDRKSDKRKPARCHCL
jgi:hypothetical protein